MSGSELLERLQPHLSQIRGTLRCDVPMSQYTWLQVGGCADVLFQPADESDLSIFLSFLPSDIPITVVGHGSNILVRDGGIEGVVIRLSGRGFGFFESLDESHIRVGASLPDKQLSMKACDIGLSGFEFYIGIVGNVGGALRMNAGAHNRETSDCVVEVNALDRDGNSHIFSNSDMNYVYRDSGVCENYIFTSALMRGIPDSSITISAQMESIRRHREESQPIRERTGGSTFQNPVSGSAWRLLDAAGLRGITRGDAQFSEMHCNFLINLGDATAHDFESLGEFARKRVFEDSGTLLQWEIRRLGRFAMGHEVSVFSP